MARKKQEIPAGMTLVKAESLEALADNIAQVAQAARSFNKVLTRRAIVVLIQDSIPCLTGKHHIENVLNSLEELDAKYLKKKAVNKP